MVNVIVLLTVEPAKVQDVAEALADLERVSEVYSVGGRFDLVVMVRARDIEEIADIVPGTILKVPGITDSETLIAFRSNSKYDLERTFSLGM